MCSSPTTWSNCLATAQARGGVPLFSPGCCGAWYHQTCIDAVIASGGKNCPMCRKALPLPAAVAAAPAPHVINPQQQQQHPPPPVTVSAAPEYTEVSRDEHQNFHVRVSLKYEEVEALSAMKVPLDVVCVLDNSGSMSGGKLESLKKAMDFVIQTLGPNDRLSVINFNSHPTVLHGLLKMSPVNQGTAKSRIHVLNATGGTNILEGMQQGWSTLENRQTRNPASCMFLLTDGQDRDNTQEKLDLARRMKSAGTSLFVFGFGTDHDSEHMVSPVTIVPMIVF
jgi:uncharacterized protein YegL